MVTPLSVVGISRYARPDKDFERYRRAFVRNRELSHRAHRVALVIMSHADGFVQTQEQLAWSCRMSVTTVRAALDDLRKGRYLVSRRLREGGRWVGTAYAVSDIPFTDAELALLCPPGAESECSESEHTGSVPPKKTTPVRETMKDKKTNPPGDQAPPGSPDAQEEPMPRTTADTEPALFDLPADSEVLESHGRQGGKSATQRVVAAFVDSHRQHHGIDPTRGEIGRVAREVKRLIGNPSTEAELTAAATAMGQTVFANIAVQLKKIRERAAVDKGRAPAHPHGATEWVNGEQAAHDAAALLLQDHPELAAWRAGEAISA